MIKTDFLVIGSGIAGLTYALKVAAHMPSASITIITKSDESESNTKYAQGGIAVALNEKFDSAEQHISDTLKAGDGLCNREIVEIVVNEGTKRLNEIIGWGAQFDKKSSGKFDLGREGGHSVNRIVHHKDITGLELERKLLKQIHNKSNIQILPHCFAIDLITEHHLSPENEKTKTVFDPDCRQADFQTLNSELNCYGAYILDKKNNSIEKISSRITLLATGGIGQVYSNTTNPLIATGDGIAMASRAGTEISNMEFIQFHPTALHNHRESPSFLISEAVRGFGAFLKTKQEKRFMFDYDKRGELASRDIVARAIDYEIKKSGDECVYLDCRHLEIKNFKKHFPNIYEKCKNFGIDIRKEMVPVVPAAHYLCGGINTNAFGKTNIHRLYACGECADTGLHGANRLASNSLLEALVFAHRCFLSSVSEAEKNFFSKSIPDWNAEGTINPKENILITHSRSELQMIMNDYVGIVRSENRLHLAKKRIKMLEEEIKQLYERSILSPQLCELRNLITVGKLIVNHSINRTENKGVFYKLQNENKTIYKQIKKNKTKWKQQPSKRQMVKVQ